MRTRRDAPSQRGAFRGISQTFSRWSASCSTTITYGGAILGVRIPLGWVSFRLEALFGGTSLSISQHSPLGDYTSTAGHGLIEPHVFVDIWTTPSVTLSAYAGANVFDTKEHTAGLVLEWHGRSFDGQFAFW